MIAALYSALDFSCVRQDEYSNSLLAVLDVLYWYFIITVTETLAGILINVILSF